MVNVLLNWLKHPGTFHLCTSVIQVLRDSRQNAVNWVPLKKKRTFHFHFALRSFWRMLSWRQVLLILEFFRESQLARFQTIIQNKSFFAKFSKQELFEYSPTPARLLPFQMQIIETYWRRWFCHLANLMKTENFLFVARPVSNDMGSFRTTFPQTWSNEIRQFQWKIH